MALGARMREVVAGLVREAVVLALCGVGLGAALAFVTSRILISSVPGIGALHSTSLMGAAALFVAVAVVASWLPARRAAGVDPARILQEE
jgi:ABC-type antimicrobial peptide transport system permease subunit